MGKILCECVKTKEGKDETVHQEINLEKDPSDLVF